MMVTFVSECEKKALKNTRRVLDAFANRIGSRTWQTVITQEGLKAVKKLLRKTASKNSAVACHWQRSRSRSDLIWIVGNRDKFNEEGYVPVNATEQDPMKSHWENDWHYLPLIKSLAGFAALFHDWGKASEFFQSKLRSTAVIGDPLRHEWLSVLFLTLVVNGEEDEQWLAKLADEGIESSSLHDRLEAESLSKKKRSKLLAKLPNAASLLAWLIVSHHRLPLKEDANYETVPAPEMRSLLKQITEHWGYQNLKENYKENLARCLDFSKGLPSGSNKWQKEVRKTARKLLGCLSLLEQCLKDGSWRVILHHSRLALMLADHYQSSLGKESKWHNEIDLYANTDKDNNLKQKLTEHLLRVAKQAQTNTHILPAFEGKHAELEKAYDVKVLQQKSLGQFKWQDKAVNRIIEWRNIQGKQLDDSHFGFFAVNMASTGKGKTFANAKIMRALSSDQQSLRYLLALGLRTLTLQTGDEYRERIGLSKAEVGVLIGSRAVLDLHMKNKEHESGEEAAALTGSESEESLLENELVFDSTIPDEHLATVLQDLKCRKFLYAPVISCTIDHLMAATETKRGGKHILPTLRLMSSDLVIDEIDDFTDKDLIAIGRLIHLAGMLGRKVMISSATIPPDLAEGYLNAYQAGWAIFSKTRNSNYEVGCCWIDEFTTKVTTINCSGNTKATLNYRELHEKFIKNRVRNLTKQIVKRKGEIWPCPILESEDEEQIRPYFYSTVLSAILTKHNHHHGIDRVTEKRVSFGLVRVANIAPCIELTRHLLNANLQDDVEIRTMAYHSQQLLIMRSAQEKHLDEVLKRKNGSQLSFDHPEIRNHLNTIEANNVIFILVATPVEEVGRDHDFDWAVVEPSSYRSFIQLAGRVLRHRELTEDIPTANISLLQHNLKGLQKKDKKVFYRPGYESENNTLQSHDLFELLAGESFDERLDAVPRICRKRTEKPHLNLADLEHSVIHNLLTEYEQEGPESLQGWLSSCWWLTAMPQWFVEFRKSCLQLIVYLSPEDGEWVFVEKDRFGKTIPVENQYGITWDAELSAKEVARLWLHRDYESLLEGLGKPSLQKAALVYGELGLPTYGKEDHKLTFIYSSQLGLIGGD